MWFRAPHAATCVVHFRADFHPSAEAMTHRREKSHESETERLQRSAERPDHNAIEDELGRPIIGHFEHRNHLRVAFSIPARENGKHNCLKVKYEITVRFSFVRFPPLEAGRQLIGASPRPVRCKCQRAESRRANDSIGRRGPSHSNFAERSEIN